MTRACGSHGAAQACGDDSSAWNELRRSAWSATRSRFQVFDFARFPTLFWHAPSPSWLSTFLNRSQPSVSYTDAAGLGCQTLILRWATAVDFLCYLMHSYPSLGVSLCKFTQRSNGPEGSWQFDDRLLRVFPYPQGGHDGATLLSCGVLLGQNLALWLSGLQKQ